MAFRKIAEAVLSIQQWGVPPSSDPRKAKRIHLSNRVALIACAAALAYGGVYPLFGAPRLAILSLLAALGAALIPFLNRSGFTWASRFYLAMSGMVFIPIFSLALGLEAGVHLFLLPIAWLVLVLFDWEERKSMAWGVGLACLALLGLEAFGPAHGLLYPLTARQERLFHAGIVATAQIFQVLVVLHFILTNRRTESALASAGEAAQAADRSKSQFLANMSHEIRTPLNGILGMSSLLLKSEMREEQKDLTQAIQSSGLDLMAIISEILDLSKIEAGKMRLDRAPFDLRSLVESLLRPFEHEARRKRLGLAMDIAPGLPERVVGDSLRLKQVLNNLIGNALKFTQKGGVTLRIRKEGPGEGGAASGFPFRFEVEDTGIGIAEEERSRIFQSFSQAEPSTAFRYGGTGLGLYISRQLVEMMGGSIGFASSAGKGSVFHFTLPLATEAAAPEAAHGKGSAEAGGKPAPGARILIVEDHPLNQKVLSGFLFQFGFRADVVSRGEDAIRVHSGAPYDLIFMDCHMPGMDGFECTRSIRNLASPGKRPAIIGVTADAMPGTRERCLEAGMDDVITKPILTGEIRRALSRWLGPDQAGEEAAPPSRRQVPLSPSDSASRWVDTRHLLEMDEWIRVYDPGFWDRAQEQFRASAERLSESIREHLEAGDLREAGESAHALKGLCLMMGLSRLGEICQRLEPRGGAPDPAWRDLLSELKALLEPSLSEMRKQVGQA